MLPQPLAQGPFAQVDARRAVTPGEGGIVVQRQARHVGARIAQLAQQRFDLCGRGVGFADMDDGVRPRRAARKGASASPS